MHGWATAQLANKGRVVATSMIIRIGDDSYVKHSGAIYIQDVRPNNIYFKLANSTFVSIDKNEIKAITVKGKDMLVYYKKGTVYSLYIS